MPYFPGMYGLYTHTSYINYTLKKRASSVPFPDSLIPPNFGLFVLISASHKGCRGIFPMYSPIMLLEVSRFEWVSGNYIVRATRLPQEHRAQPILSLDYLILGLPSYATPCYTSLSPALYLVTNP